MAIGQLAWTGPQQVIQLSEGQLAIATYLGRSLRSGGLSMWIWLGTGPQMLVSGAVAGKSTALGLTSTVYQNWVEETFKDQADATSLNKPDHSDS